MMNYLNILSLLLALISNIYFGPKETNEMQNFILVLILVLGENIGNICEGDYGSMGTAVLSDCRL